MQEQNYRKAAQTLSNALDLIPHVLCIVLFICYFIVFFGRTIGSSMMPTLGDGQVFIIQRIGYTASQGDIVLIQKDDFPYKGEHECIVKRVIATEGQTIYIDYDANTVYVDGIALDEEYIYEPMIYDQDMIYNMFTVPQGCVFVMGDNRNNSVDSRFGGAVETKYIIGKVLTW